jgi:hypothetical protein
MSFVHRVAERVSRNFKRRVPTGPMASQEILVAGINRALPLGNSLIARAWAPKGLGPAEIEFELPTINTFCDTCQSTPPFNPIVKQSHVLYGPEQNDGYLLSYQCQQCKGPLIHFMVRRENLKLRITGRDPLEILPTPKVLPKTVSKYYSHAQIAHHAGQTLAGLFLLRVFVEQYWRQIPAVQELLKTDARATGERQGEAYQADLPKDFKERFPSLKDVYGQLSAALHAADANAALFDEACAKVLEHFDARRLYRI